MSRTLSVYLAGKIDEYDWRHTIFADLDYTSESYTDFRSGIRYSGPFFMPSYHGVKYHGETKHGRGAGAYEEIDERAYFKNAYGYSDAEIEEIISSEDYEEIWLGDSESRKEVFEKCLDWIRKSDSVFVWMDSSDAFGTLVEVGYAKALGKEIFIGIDEKVKDEEFIKEIWFSLQCAYQVVVSKTPLEAWEIFEKTTPLYKSRLATEKQLKYAYDLAEKNKCKLILGDEPKKTEVGKIIAYFTENKYEEDMEQYLVKMTEAEVIELERNRYRFTKNDVLKLFTSEFDASNNVFYSINKALEEVVENEGVASEYYQKVVSQYGNYTLYNIKWLNKILKMYPYTTTEMRKKLKSSSEEMNLEISQYKINQLLTKHRQSLRKEKYKYFLKKKNAYFYTELMFEVVQAELEKEKTELQKDVG